MELFYHPAIHERTGYQFFTEKDPSLKSFRNINTLSLTWDKGTVKIIRQELIRGNLTLIISTFDVTEPVIITRHALSVNDVYIFDLTLTEEEYMQTFDQETVYCKKDLDCFGFSAGTVQMVQTRDTGYLSYRAEILVSRSYLLHFINQLSLDEKSEIDNNDDFFQILSLSLSEVKLVHSLVDMYQNGEQAKKIARILSTNLVHEIMAKLLGRLHSKSETGEETVRRSDFNKIMEVKSMMESRLEAKYKMEEICNYCSMSISKFKYLFKSVMGYSFSNYYTKIRMEEAARQLENRSTENISQLSLQLGYKNLSQFTRTFKDYFNHSPTDFLKSQKPA